jgi:hypothetical protein
VKKALVACGLFAVCVSAGAVRAGVGATAELGTTGIGAHVGIRLLPDLELRLGTGYLTHSYSRHTTYLKYDFKLQVHTVDMLLDWYPSEKSGLRLTAGVAYNGNKIDARAKPSITGSYTLGTHTYTVESIGRIDGKADFRRVAPYLGVGWGRAAVKTGGWSFSTDLGVLLQGSPRTSLTSRGCTILSLVCELLAADLPRENRELSDDLGKYKIYPVVRVGVSYAF